MSVETFYSKTSDSSTTTKSPRREQFLGDEEYELRSKEDSPRHTPIDTFEDTGNTKAGQDTTPGEEKPGNVSTCSDTSVTSRASLASVASSIKHNAPGRTPFLCGEIVHDISAIVIGGFYEVLSGDNIEVIEITEQTEDGSMAGGNYYKCIGKKTEISDKAVFVKDKFWRYEIHDFKARLKQPTVYRKGKREYFYFDEIPLEGTETE